MKDKLREASPWGAIVWWAPIVIVGVYVAVWHSLYPPAFDDLVYTRQYLRTFPDEIFGGLFLHLQPFNETVGQAMQSFWNHYNNVNGRFAHVFAYLMPLTPDWVQGTADGIIMSLVMWLLMRLAAQLGDFRRVPAWLVAIIVAATPWLFVMSEGMVSRDFFINYYWSAAPALGCLLLWYRRSSDAPASAVKYVLLFILGFLAGSMHEIWGLTLLAAFVGEALLHWRMPRGSRRRTMFAGLLIGVALCSFSASNVNRATYDNYILNYILYELLPSPKRFMYVSFAVKIGLVVGVASLLTRLGLRMLWSPLGLAMAIMFFTSVGFAIFANGGRRAMLPAACVTIVYGAAFFLNLLPALQRPLKGLAGALGVALAVWFGCIISVQAKLAPREWHFYNRLLAVEKEVKVDGKEPPTWLPWDVPSWGESPWWTNAMPALVGDDAFFVERYSHIASPDATHLVGFGDYSPTPGNSPLLGTGPFYIPKNKTRGESINLIVTLGPPCPSMRPWKRLHAPATITVAEEMEPAYHLYCITPEGDTLIPMRNTCFEEAYSRSMLRVDTIPAL